MKTMDEFMKYTIGGLITIIVGILGWAFNISSRIAVIERAHEDLKEFLDIRLSRIERALNGSLKHE